MPLQSCPAHQLSRSCVPDSLSALSLRISSVWDICCSESVLKHHRWRFRESLRQSHGGYHMTVWVSWLFQASGISGVLRSSGWRWQPTYCMQLVFWQAIQYTIADILPWAGFNILSVFMHMAQWLAAEVSSAETLRTTDAKISRGEMSPPPLLGSCNNLWPGIASAVCPWPSRWTKTISAGQLIWESVLSCLSFMMT